MTSTTPLWKRGMTLALSLALFFGGMEPSLAAGEGNIGTPKDNPVDKNMFAWSDQGWIDLNELGAVFVQEDALRGYAWNEQIGHIHLNCEAFQYDVPESEPGFEIDTPYYCGGSQGSYAVLRDPDTNKLSGKAFAEDMGEFIYFDEASYLADHGGNAGDYGSFGVSISCDSMTGRGDFMGRAWSESIGWVYFGQSDIESIKSGYDASAIYPVTWGCPVDVSGANQYEVFAATDTHTYSIATGPEGLCDNANNALRVTRVDDSNAMGTITPTCTDEDGDGLYDVNITLAGEMSETADLYQVNGSLTDPVSGTTFSFPETGAREDLFFFHVIAGALDYDSSVSITETDDPMIADGEDEYKFSITPQDRYGNLLKTVYKHKDENSATIIEIGESKISIEDHSRLNQVDLSDEEVISNSALKITSSGTDCNRPAETHHCPLEENIITIMSISSYAPVLGDSNGKVFLKTLSVEQKVGTVTGVNVASLEANYEHSPNKNLLFKPILVSNNITLPDTMITSSKNLIPITLTNQSNSVDVNAFDWMGIAYTSKSLNSFSQGEGVYKTNIYDSTVNEENIDTATPIGDQVDQDHYKEGLGGSFNISSSAFEVLLSDLLNITPNSPPKMTSDGMNHGDTFFLVFSAQLNSNNPLVDEYPHFAHYIAITIDGKLVKYMLDKDSVSLSTTSTKGLGSQGATSGQNAKIDSESTSHSSSNYSTENVLSTIRKSYNSIIREFSGNAEKYAPTSTSATLNCNDIKTLLDSNVITANTSSSLVPGVISHKEGDVLWFKKPEGSNPFLLVIEGDGGTCEITEDDLKSTDTGNTDEKRPITILVDGGNVLIKDDLVVTGKYPLAIIVLESQQAESDESGAEGNLFVEADVTHIDALMYLDNSLLSVGPGLDENSDLTDIEPEILDGFTNNRSDFVHQLYIRGTLVAKFAADAEINDYIPRGSLLPEECDDDCSTLSEEELSKAAQRFHLFHFRDYRISAIFEKDTDEDGIKDDMDCSTDPNACDGGFYNTTCEVNDGDKDATNNEALEELPEECTPSTEPIGEEIFGGGKCADGTPWCSNGALNTEDADNDGVEDYKKYEDARSSLFIGADPRVKQYPPRGTKTVPEGYLENISY